MWFRQRVTRLSVTFKRVHNRCDICTDMHVLYCRGVGICGCFVMVGVWLVWGGRGRCPSHGKSEMLQLCVKDIEQAQGNPHDTS